MHLRRPTTPLIAVALAAVMLAGATAMPGGAAPAPAAAATGCGKVPGTLSPKGTGPARFTMLIRINKLINAQQWADIEPDPGGLRDRVRSQDVFVINTRFGNSTPEEWDQITDLLQAEFPCNRLIALNGLRTNPEVPGYRYALVDRGLYSTVLDWELDDWIDAKRDSRSLPGWTLDFEKNRRRIAKRVGKNSRVSQNLVPPSGRRVGLAPSHYSEWDYGLFARAIDQRNRARKRGRRGHQIVQIQNHCGGGEETGFRAATARLLRQYRPPPVVRTKTVRRKGKLKKIRFKKKVRPRAMHANLSVEVSFSNTPNPNDPRPVARVSAAKAAGCTRAALKRGAGAFLYWASPFSMATFLDKRVICPLRPPGGKRSAC